MQSCDQAPNDGRLWKGEGAWTWCPTPMCSHTDQEATDPGALARLGLDGDGGRGEE